MPDCASQPSISMIRNFPVLEAGSSAASLALHITVCRGQFALLLEPDLL